MKKRQERPGAGMDGSVRVKQDEAEEWKKN